MRHRFLFFPALAVVAIVACHIGPTAADKIADGEPCAGHIADCKSDSCVYDLCTGSSCKCNGSSCPPGGVASGDCQAGWLCYHGESSSDFFGGGGGPFDQCRMPCGGADGGVCPPRMRCSSDKLCEADSNWSAPAVTITSSVDVDAVVVPGAATITFHGEATSPVGDVGPLTFGWSIPSDDGKNNYAGDTTGHDVSLHPTTPGSAYPVELTVTDSKSRRGTARVVVKTCGTADFFCSGSDPSDIPCCGALTCKSFKCSP